MSFLGKKELNKFKSVGTNVLISKDALFFGPENITIGNNVRIDAANIFLCKNGYMKIGNYVHLAVRSTFLCCGGIEIQDFAQVAANNTLLSSSDDFSGKFLIGPTVPIEYRNVFQRKIVIGVGAVIGVGCVLSPGTHMNPGAALGALSFTTKDQLLPMDSISVGTPAKMIKARSQNHLALTSLLGNRNSVLPRRKSRKKRKQLNGSLNDLPDKSSNKHYENADKHWAQKLYYGLKKIFRFIIKSS